jgi:hypothetical protein
VSVTANLSMIRIAVGELPALPSSARIGAPAWKTMTWL